MAQRDDHAQSKGVAADNVQPPSGQATQVLKFRLAQREFIKAIEQHRLIAFVARRQFGKTTTFAAVALKKMMKRKNHTVIFGSAKLNLSREIVRKEAQILKQAIDALTADSAPGAIQIVEGGATGAGKVRKSLDSDAFADIFEQQRLEFRYYHDKTGYSRTKVVALKDDTVGETGDLMCDEIGRVKNWRDVWEAIEPIISSDPTFRLTLATTPPPDDSHYSFEQLNPPVGTTFPVNAKGNFYRSEMGIMVLRVSAFDAWADGVPVYDLDKGEALSPEDHRARAHDKSAWDRNYAVNFLIGGSAACSSLMLSSAQERGLHTCKFFLLEEEADFVPALDWIVENLTANPIGLGLDLATTEKDTSNPSSFTILEQAGNEVIGRCTVAWKTNQPKLAKRYIRTLVEAVNARKAGGRARKLCIDASNERYFATELRDELRALVPCELVLGGERAPASTDDEPQNFKSYLGNLLIAELDDNHLTLPPERYIKEDFRLVKRDRGSFDTEISADGKHGDTFDSHKLALWALVGSGGPFQFMALPQSTSTASGGTSQPGKARRVLL